MYANNLNDEIDKVKNDVKNEYIKEKGILTKLIKNI